MDIAEELIILKYEDDQIGYAKLGYSKPSTNQYQQKSDQIWLENGVYNSNDVKVLQIMLKELGYYHGEVDKDFGDVTEDAVNRYKEDRGLGNTGSWRGVVGNQTWEMIGKDYLAEVRSKNESKGTSQDDLIRKLESEPENVNYRKMLDIIKENGITDFTYDIFQSLINSEINGKVESANYILGDNFQYLAGYNGTSSHANFYALMVEGEITLIRVGRDKTQVGFYDITNTDFFSQQYDGRTVAEIFDDYLPTTGLDQDLNQNAKLLNDDYKFYENKATNTTDILWKNLKSDSKIIKELARGLDTIRGEEDGTGIAEDFGEVYKKTKYYPEKDNAFVLGEIYGHADGLNDFNWFRIAGKNEYRYWIADVENPNTIPTGRVTRLKQKQQNDRWKGYGKGR